MKASEIDKRFDDGEDVSDVFDFTQARRPNRDVRRVNVDLPVWVISALDLESTRIGVTRQSLIKMWLAERLERSVS